MNDEGFESLLPPEDEFNKLNKQLKADEVEKILKRMSPEAIEQSFLEHFHTKDWLTGKVVKINGLEGKVLMAYGGSLEIFMTIVVGEELHHIDISDPKLLEELLKQ